jgi:transposase
MPAFYGHLPFARARRWSLDRESDSPVLKCGFSCLQNVQRAWSPKGQTHVADASLGRKRLSVLGSLEYGVDPQLHYESFSGSVKAETVISFLDRLAAGTDPSRFSIFVLDNASIHHAIPQDKHDQWLIEHRLFLYYLPPYSPELNLIEIVWKLAKYHWRRFASWAADQLQTEVHALLDGFGSKYKICFT